MSDSPPQVQHGYYYSPMSQGGSTEQRLGPLGEVAGRFAVSYAAFLGSGNPQAASLMGAGGVGSIVGSIGRSIFSDTGRLIDNLPNIVKNLDTAMAELNDSRTWISPSLGDE
ncbi:hypothetical protein [Bradyrhizobium elkanii]|uniref:Uncharacterized protein n=1 Tax=Bradyrhizobium elkanii TaxID=29448 RepID=A0ABV4F022_BRAEL|nr:hypothetical protein [Bradyrhizobium elkanii]MCP1757784.1 hypothetical protein [Bradyrhizobium elkanii]MCS3881919.1 hypothetical protein [Bradyrhizobium elkanii]MCS4218679.1 hypothetical protein [Bradyrhizobium elkanii]MCW2110023.1 hypothetical protein [Bradyrhizobium elkanii]MCW2201606.1 hypothetical protein [Bradyrhizobium elkanii]